MAINKQIKAERDRCLQAVDDEEELEGDMPDEFWERVNGMNREDMSRAFQACVRVTKRGIRNRIEGGFS